MMKIALFGTSADPPTAAHVTICQWLTQRFDRVAVWASDNPFKHHHCSLGDRQRMLQLVIEHLDPPCPQVAMWSDLSDRRSLRSLERAQAIWGQDQEYYLVVGSDLLVQIPRWYRVEELLQQCTLVVFPRPGYPLTPGALAPLQQLGAHYQLATPTGIAQPQTVPPPPLTAAISSTHFRQTKDQQVIPSVVRHYIQQHHLYADA